MLFTSKEDVFSEDTVVIPMPVLNKNEDVELTKVGKGRKSRLKIDQSSLMKLRNRKFFRGFFLKNKTSFQIGGKEFVVESNIR